MFKKKKNKKCLSNHMADDIMKFLGFFTCNVEARVRANMEHKQGEQETRRAGEGRTKQWGTETTGDLWKGDGW